MKLLLVWLVIIIMAIFSSSGAVLYFSRLGKVKLLGKFFGFIIYLGVCIFMPMNILGLIFHKTNFFQTSVTRVIAMMLWALPVLVTTLISQQKSKSNGSK